MKNLTVGILKAGVIVNVLLLRSYILRRRWNVQERTNDKCYPEICPVCGQICRFWFGIGGKVFIGCANIFCGWKMEV